jgi:RimJ/RimL family protein N-acetyltransferase
MSLKLKKIKLEDNQILFKWANLKSVRDNSLNKKKINYNHHLKWLEKYLNKSPKHVGKLIYIRNKAIGFIRLDKKNSFFFISYLISPRFRKKGYATKAIKLLIKNLNNGQKIVAIVKNNNIASIKIFEKLNFRLMLKTSKYHKFKYNVKNKKK